MVTEADSKAESEGRLADNIVYFARALRRAGMRVGPAAVTEAVEAVKVAGIGSREDFYWTLHAVFVNRHEDHVVFDEAFKLFWRSRQLIEKMIAMFSPVAMDHSEQEQRAAQTRASQALNNQQNEPREREEPEIEFDATFTSSDKEVLRTMDFAQMTAEEIARAKQELSRLILPHDRVKTRRFKPSTRTSRVDPRATMRTSLKTGGSLILPRFREHKSVHPPLVVLADISGSMSQYTRIFLHFMHVLTEKRRRVHTFLFGTRLTNVTRQMRYRDPDEALAECTSAVTDWSGGTRISDTLREFNRLWSRRVLSQGAIVLLITDGLEREGVDDLPQQMERLQKSCRRLVWLNPLLRFDGFEARAMGVRAMLPFVHEFRPVHNLEALSDLVTALEVDNRKLVDPRRFMAAAS
ncbi:MAG: VWA domain-containing protein [Pseudomonadota bacterium]